MERTVVDIRADLAAAYEARRRALIPGYSLDSGQGRQSVQPIDLSKIAEVISSLEWELADATDTTGGVQTGTFDRHSS